MVLRNAAAPNCIAISGVRHGIPVTVFVTMFLSRCSHHQGVPLKGSHFVIEQDCGKVHMVSGQTRWNLLHFGIPGRNAVATS